MRKAGILKAKEKQAIKDRKFALEKKEALKQKVYTDAWDEGKIYL